ncbi:hypothetical protein TNCV_3754531 [Trichonephila clavipes]|nr:hypothetical protein TNCV_3754531 [Trichonephila clavipes]
MPSDKANGAMKTSSVEFISRSPNPSPKKSEHRRFVLLRKIFQPWQWKRRKREIVLNRRPELYRGKYVRCVQPKINLLKKLFLCRFSSGLHGNTAADSVRSEWPLWHAAKSKDSLRAQAQLMRTETVETVELVKVKQKLLRERSSEGERERCASRRYLLNIIVNLICNHNYLFN